jgi:hypothetical protein
MSATRGRWWLRSRAGFALPVALVLLVLLAMMSTTGLYVARSDFRAAQATRHAALALAAADAGATRTIATWAQAVPTLPNPGDSIDLGWQSLPDGSQFNSLVVRPPIGVGETAGSWVVLRTVGRMAPPEDARRTVVTVVAVSGGTPLCCTTALKTTRNLDVRGPNQNNGVTELDGQDRIPPGWGAECTAPLANVPGATSSDTSRVDLLFTGNIGGTPPKVEDTGVDPLDFTNLGPTTYAALAALASPSFTGNRTLVPAPVALLGQCVTTLPTNWGSPLDPSGPCGTYFPVIRVSGNLTLPAVGQGQGILLVDGDLTISGNFQFHGVIIVLGVARVRAGTIYGGLMARGNANGNGRSEVRNPGRVLFSSCAVSRALSVLPAGMAGGALVAAESGWFEPIS